MKYGKVYTVTTKTQRGRERVITGEAFDPYGDGVYVRIRTQRGTEYGVTCGRVGDQVSKGGRPHGRIENIIEEGAR